MAAKKETEKVAGRGLIDWASRAAVGVVVAGCVGAAVFGYGPLMRRAAELRASDPRIEVWWPTLAHVDADETMNVDDTWMPRQEREKIERAARLALSRNPFDARSLEEAHRALAATGWFASGPRVERSATGTLTVRGEWRTPAAVVRQGGVDRLVTRDGLLLPLEYPENGAGTLRVIAGVWAEPPRTASGQPAYGEAWVGGDVQAALALLDMLRTSAVWQHVAGVDASSYMKNGRLVIATAGGGRVVWGAAPGKQAPGEQSDAVKLARLTNLLTNGEWARAGRPTAELYTPVVMVQDGSGR